MPRTLTGSYTFSGAVKHSEDSTYENTTNKYVGGEYENGVLSELYLLLLEPGTDELFADVDPATVTGDLVLTLTLKKKSLNTNSAELFVGALAKAVTYYSASSLWNGILNADIAAYEWATPQHVETEQTISISFSSAVAAEILQNGIILRSDYQDLFQITSAVLTADVSDRKVPPVIELIHGFGQIIDGKYWHFPENEFTLIVHYSQEVDEPISQISLTVTFDSGRVAVEYGDIGSTSVTVPTYMWSSLPRSGTIKLEAHSEAGVYANTIEMPFEVAMYDVAFTSHTSGTIIQSDADLTLTWEATKPNSGWIDMGAPTGYTIWYWWDDESRSSGWGVTETSYTIAASRIAEHSVLHAVVVETYGDDMSERDPDTAAVLNLYIQQVAGVGTVTVSPVWFATDPPIYYPRITVSWEATGQTAYQVRVGDAYDSGAIWGTASEHNVQKMLDAGVYPVTVRIQDTQGVWGDWTTPVLVTIEKVTGEKNQITAVLQENEVVISVELEEVSIYGTVLLYRDGVMIGQKDVGEETTVQFTDRNANGSVSYFARCVSATSGAYWPTETVTVDATPETDGIWTEDGTWIPLRYTGTFPRQYPVSTAEETYAKYYSGRAYPVYMRSGRKRQEITLSYMDKGSLLADRIEAAAGQCVLYKNRAGLVIYGELNSVSANRNGIWCTAGFTIARADFAEEIPYTW